MSDDVGVLQHAVETLPNRKFGYCTDDVARAFMVALAHARLAPAQEPARRLAANYLAFLQHAQLDDGRFHNFMDYDRRWADDVGTQDSCGRAMWALGYGMEHAPDDVWRRICRSMLESAVASLEWLEYPRSWTYAMLGLAHAHAAHPTPALTGSLNELADRLARLYEVAAHDEWPWFENAMTYDNARLPQALLRAGRALQDERYIGIGLTSLRFYESVTMEGGIFVPIGNAGWYERGRERARYAQQPLEAVAMLDAQLAAFDVTGDTTHVRHAQAALEWYYGKNSRGVRMAHGGACYDGLQEQVVNTNCGAESTLAFLAAAYASALRRARVLEAVR
ncbi:MAG: hypothetical protein JO030_08345 [Candidatus Eremiobacteraeota bacterium]|nr:hypothetical protein [Candidatus Eremiobacteraeota bacterium]